MKDSLIVNHREERHRPAYEPEKALAVAVLDCAVEDMLKFMRVPFGKSNSTPNWLSAKRASDWIRSDERVRISDGYTFATICDLMGVDVDKTRAGIMERVKIEEG